MDRNLDEGLGLAEAVDALRADLLRARDLGRDSDLQFPIESMTVELRLGLVRSAEGRAGFRVPIVNAELGAAGGWQREAMQTVTVVFGSPVDHEGRPAHRVERSSDEPLA